MSNKKIILEKRRTFSDQFYCNITKELDLLTGIQTKDNNGFFRHYILSDEWCSKERCLAIRLPGRTVGGVWITEDNVIYKIVVCDYDGKEDKDINDKIQKYIGCVIVKDVCGDKESE